PPDERRDAVCVAFGRRADVVLYVLPRSTNMRDERECYLDGLPRRSKVYTKAARSTGRPFVFPVRAMTTQKPIAIYYEHPEWFRPLFEELDRRGLPYVRLDASRRRFDPSADESGFALFFNRMSASAYLRGHANAIFYTREYLAHLERKGVRVVNGHDSFLIETSKAAQLALLDSLGLPYPPTRVINHPAEGPHAARDLRF